VAGLERRRPAEGRSQAGRSALQKILAVLHDVRLVLLDM
jgi:hypothetical protein